MPPIFYREEGKGFPLVFLHGFCETHEIWEEFIKSLASEFRIILLDLPGFGKSPLPAGNFSIDDVGDAVSEWLATNQIMKSVIIGHSLGGYVALSIGERHPGVLTGLGLFHSTSFTDSEEKKENRNKVIDFVNRHGVEPFIETFVPGLFFNKTHPAIPEVRRIAMQTAVAAITGYARAMRDRIDRSAVLRNREIPKFLIAGAQDTIIPRESTEKMAEIAQNCRIYQMEGTAHMGFFEAQKECLKAIRESLDKFRAV